MGWEPRPILYILAHVRLQRRVVRCRIKNACQDILGDNSQLKHFCVLLDSAHVLAHKKSTIW